MDDPAASASGHSGDLSVAYQSAGVPYIKLHGLRHLIASVALSEGANPKAVSEVLGHADIHTTLAIYSQFIPDIDDDVVQTVDAFLLGSTEGS